LCLLMRAPGAGPDRSIGRPRIFTEKIQLPIIHHLIVPQDILVAVVGDHFKVNINRPIPAVKDLDDAVALVPQFKAERPLTRLMAGITGDAYFDTFHTDEKIHRPWFRRCIPQRRQVCSCTYTET